MTQSSLRIPHILHSRIRCGVRQYPKMVPILGQLNPLRSLKPTQTLLPRWLLSITFPITTWAEIAQSLQGLVTGWTVRGSNTGGGEIFRTRPDQPWGPPSPLYNGYRVFPGGKAAGAWRWPPTPVSAEVKVRVELYLYSPSGHSWPVLGWTLPLPLPSIYTFFPHTSCACWCPACLILLLSCWTLRLLKGKR
jgi:hypothetical protein